MFLINVIFFIPLNFYFPLTTFEEKVYRLKKKTSESSLCHHILKYATPNTSGLCSISLANDCGMADNRQTVPYKSGNNSSILRKA